MEIFIGVTFILYATYVAVMSMYLGDEYGLLKDIRKDDLGLLLLKFSIFPTYIVILVLFILISPILVPCYLYSEIDSVRKFFDQKPLEFLLNYSIEFRKKEK